MNKKEFFSIGIAWLIVAIIFILGYFYVTEDNVGGFLYNTITIWAGLVSTLISGFAFYKFSTFETDISIY